LDLFPSTTALLLPSDDADHSGRIFAALSSSTGVEVRNCSHCSEWIAFVWLYGTRGREVRDVVKGFYTEYQPFYIRRRSMISPWFGIGSQIAHCLQHNNVVDQINSKGK